MDDMKRAIYLELLRTLEATDSKAHICVQLQRNLEDIFGVVADRSSTSLVNLLTEFFPEFVNLYDGYKYDIDDRHEWDINGSWFTVDARHARLSLIYFLLTHR